MEQSNKIINATVSEVTPDTLTAWASVEVIDEDGDIIRIKGIDLSYHTEESPIKIFPDHTYVNELNAMPVVIGKVESIQKTVYKDGTTPALKFEMSWAKKPNGSLTELAKAYKELYETKYLDSFSIGVGRESGVKIENGVDWEETKLIEISCASIPANKYANVIKTLNKHGIKVKNMSEVLKKDLDQSNPSGVQDESKTGVNFGVKDMQDAMETMSAHVTKCHKDLGDMMTAHISKCVDGLCKSMNDRMDDIESAIAVNDDVAQDGPEATYSQKALKELNLKKDLEAKKVKAQEEMEQAVKALADLRKSLIA